MSTGKVKMTNIEIATALVNKWISLCLGLSPSEQGKLLIELISKALDNAIG